ncbi:competence type IV pilus ATPase ComGA [Aerococcaceae bacterium WGS1372]
MIEGDAIKLIEEAIKLNSSDIHILPTKTRYNVYFRTEGQLMPHQQESLDWGKRLISHLKFLANMDVGEKRRPQSGSASMELEGGTIEIRLSTITSVLLLESMVIRVLKTRQGLQSHIETFFPQDIEVLRRLTRLKSGLILFSGPVGSGKTTTIYQLLRERIQHENLQIITMEDPVEMYEERFLQTEVNERAGITYDLLIKSSLRHHPDILMIGEIRDEETAKMAVRGALTGHLLIATIHAKNTRGVIARLQELSVSDEQLRQTIIGIISQRLVPKLCPQCKNQCSHDCQFIIQSNKRAVLFELLTGNALNEVLSGKVQLQQFISLNKKLRKAWAYGFIDSKNYKKFKIF